MLGVHYPNYASHLCVIKMLIAHQTLIAVDFEVRSPKAQMN